MIYFRLFMQNSINNFVVSWCRPPLHFSINWNIIYPNIFQLNVKTDHHQPLEVTHHQFYWDFSCWLWLLSGHSQLIEVWSPLLCREYTLLLKLLFLTKVKFAVIKDTLFYPSHTLPSVFNETRMIKMIKDIYCIYIITTFQLIWIN